MLCQLSSSHNDGQSMVMYSSGMKHARPVNIVSWQQSEHVMYSSGIKHALLLSSHDNGQSMVIYPSSIKHAPSVAIVAIQRTGHVYSSLRYETCSVSRHRPITTVRARWCILQVWNMLLQLPLSHDNGQSMIMYSLGMKHGPSVVIVSWQRSEPGNVFLSYETCSDSCWRLMTTVRAWLCISRVWNMLRKLPSSHDNVQGMFIHL